MNKGKTMKYKILTAILLMAMPLLASDLDYAYRLPAELQVSEPQALIDLTWQQGSTPLIQVEVLRRGRPVDADTNTTVRMIIGPSATSTYYVDRAGRYHEHQLLCAMADRGHELTGHEYDCAGMVVHDLF